MDVVAEDDTATLRVLQLVEACKTNNAVELARLLDDDIASSTEVVYAGATLLLWACAKGSLEAVKLLTDRGANIKAVSAGRQRNALNIAAYYSADVLVCGHLIKLGLNPFSTDGQGYSAATHLPTSQAESFA
jgi:ankyrin repeat protein